MLTRSPWTPTVRDEVRPKRLPAARRQQLRDSVAEILRSGAPTIFVFEGACRHGLRSGLVLDGWRWSRADVEAAVIVAAALAILGARRPTWQQGQPEYTQAGIVPVEYRNCARCGKALDGAPTRNGWERKYCSNLCRRADRNDFELKYGKRRSHAEYWAMLATVGKHRRQQRERPCELCGKLFVTEKPHARFCSKRCSGRLNGSKRQRWKACGRCGTLYHVSGRGAGKKYCSRSCFDAARRGAPRRRASDRDASSTPHE